MSVPIIAVIEDNQEIVEVLDILLREEGYCVISYGIGRDAHDFILRTMPDLIILDLWLESADAGSMVLGLIELDPMTRNIPVIICSAHIAQLKKLHEHLQGKNYRIVQKPFEVETLLREIRAALASSVNG